MTDVGSTVTLRDFQGRDHDAEVVAVRGERLDLRVGERDPVKNIARSTAEPPEPFSWREKEIP